MLLIFASESLVHWLSWTTFERTFLTKNIAKTTLTLKTILEINDSYLMSCEKLESYKEKKRGCNEFNRNATCSFFNGADILIPEFS